MTNHSKLIKSMTDKTLTAYGYKLLWSIIDKAAKANGYHKYDNSEDAKVIKEKIKTCVLSLIFDHQFTAEQISKVNSHIKVIDKNVTFKPIER